MIQNFHGFLAGISQHHVQPPKNVQSESKYDVYSDAIPFPNLEKQVEKHATSIAVGYLNSFW
jgi:hypothetical protein